MASAGHGGTSNGTTEVADTGEASETSRGTGAADRPGADDTAGLDVICADPNAGIAWAGDWGRKMTHGCIYSLGLPEPFVVDKGLTGSECYGVTAEVWIPGVTDVDGNQGIIRTRMLIEDAGGPVAILTVPLTFDGRYGNNYRFVAAVRNGTGWFMAPAGTYFMRFQFSYGDDNVDCWYTIGQGAGPDGGAPRTLELIDY